jgi:hypothetical protein
MKKNTSTPENKAFWKHIEDAADEVRHWPKWAGGGGVKPLQCPTCNQKMSKESKNG